MVVLTVDERRLETHETLADRNPEGYDDTCYAEADLVLGGLFEDVGNTLGLHNHALPEPVKVVGARIILRVTGLGPITKVVEVAWPPGGKLNEIDTENEPK